MPDKNRSHSKISKLPADLRNAVETKLLEGHTYEQISPLMAQYSSSETTKPAITLLHYMKLSQVHGFS